MSSDRGAGTPAIDTRPDPGSRRRLVIRGLIFLLVLGNLGLLGMLALKKSTPYGLGLVNDSAAYVGGAESLLAGNGYARVSGGGEIRPITHFPPLFSLFLAAGGWLGLDLLFTARAFVLVLYAGSIVLAGLVCWQLTRSMVWSAAGAALFATSATMLRVYSFALSEPLYLTLMLLVFLLLAPHMQRSRGPWLLLAGVGLGLIYLTRYIGLALLVSAVAALWIRSPDLRRTPGRLLWIIGPALAIIGAWIARNLVVAGTASNRQILWHPITWEQFASGVQSLFPMLLPGALPADPPASSIASAVLSWCLLGALAFWAMRESRPAPRPASEADLAYSIGLSALAYGAVLVISISLLDASTPLDVRVLSPVVLALLLLGVGLLARLFHSARAAARLASAGLMLAALGLSVRGVLAAVRDLEVDGQGFASLSWQNSTAVQAVRELPEEIVIYSNRPTGIMLTTDRASYITPSPIDPSTALPRPTYEADLQEMRHRVLAGEAVLVFFGVDQQADAESADWFRSLAGGLPIWAEYNEATIYGVRDP